MYTLKHLCIFNLQPAERNLQILPVTSNPHPTKFLISYTKGNPHITSMQSIFHPVSFHKKKKQKKKIMYKKANHVVIRFERHVFCSVSK